MKQPKKIGGIKYDTNKRKKPSLALLPTQPLMEIARVLDFGAEKYVAHNWRNGIAQERLYSAALRHILASNEGQNTDEESGLLHLAHAACCIIFLLEQQLRVEIYKEFDNRYKVGEHCAD